MRRRGVTLIEVIISIAVLSIIFVPALSIFSSSRLSLKYSSDLSRELSAARSAMEWCNNKDYHVLNYINTYIQSRGKSGTHSSLYCFIKYSDVPMMSNLLEGFDLKHCVIYDDTSDYSTIKGLSNIKYDAVLKINLFDITDENSSNTIEIIVTAWSSLRKGSSPVQLTCIKGAA